MTTNTKKKSASRTPGAAESVIHVAASIALSCAVLPIFIFTQVFEGSFVIFQWMIILVYALTLAGLVTTLYGRASAWLLGTMRVISALTGVGLLYLAFGVLQDAVGVNCIGIGGTDTTCSANSLFVLQLFVANPLFLIPQALIFGTLLATGLFQSLRPPR